MAGDEKPPRELIDAAEMHQEVSCEKDCDEPGCGCADSECGWCGAEWPCLTRRLADALEAERAHMQSLAKWAGVPDSASSLEIACEVSTALEAALPGDDDWEYAMRESGEDEPWSYTHPTRELLLSAVGWMAKRQDMEILRRRPAGEPGPWEPVEEVPRG